MNGTLERPGRVDAVQGGEPRPFLLCEDLARIYTEEKRRDDPRAKAVPVGQVYSLRTKSRPGERYADNPMPKEDGMLSGNQPWWRLEREEEHREWFRSRRRPGRPPRKR